MIVHEPTKAYQAETTTSGIGPLDQHTVVGLCGISFHMVRCEEGCIRIGNSVNRIVTCDACILLKFQEDAEQ